MADQKVFINGKTEISICCPQCGTGKSVPVSKVCHVNKPVNAKCRCGHAFKVSFEKRAHYRKATRLRGDYVKNGSGGYSGDMVVEDLSRTGLSFRTLGAQNIKVGDLISLRFTLDDPQQSVVRSKAVARRIQGELVGVEFNGLDEHIKKLLGFYLMP